MSEFPKMDSPWHVLGPWRVRKARSAATLPGFHRGGDGWSSGEGEPASAIVVTDALRAAQLHHAIGVWAAVVPPLSLYYDGRERRRHAPSGPDCVSLRVLLHGLRSDSPPRSLFSGVKSEAESAWDKSNGAASNRAGGAAIVQIRAL